MINLIPPHARKYVQVEYWIRVGTVYFLLLSVTLVMVAALLIPTYVLITSQLQVYEEQYTETEAQNASYAELEQIVTVANATAQRVLQRAKEPSFSTLLEELSAVTDASIRLNTVTMNRDPKTKNIEQVQISGDASTREALAAFRNALEAHERFASAELPLSNLAKDKDVPFNITIVIDNSE